MKPGCRIGSEVSLPSVISFGNRAIVSRVRNKKTGGASDVRDSEFLTELWRFRERPGHKATYQSNKFGFSKWAEIGVFGFELFLLFGLAIPVTVDIDPYQLL